MTTTDERRAKATSAFIQKAHDIYHQRNGKDAACHRCGNIAKGEKGFNL